VGGAANALDDAMSSKKIARYLIGVIFFFFLFYFYRL